MEEQDVKQCCATFYGSDFARLLLGDSFHPGGTQLTERLGNLLALTRDSQVLDVASGRGTSAFHLAESFGCKVTGVDLSEENVRLATAEASQRGLAGQINFQLGDAERLPFGDETFDAIICECAFCTFPSKPVAAQEFFRVLKPGGQLGLSDLTRTEATIPELEGLLSWIACVGDALPADRYVAILQQAGFEVPNIEDQNDSLVEMVRQIQAKLLGAEIVAGLKKIDLHGVDFTTGKQFAQAALQATRSGALGYVVIAARKPQYAFPLPTIIL
jgi:ubiquinone/menaquinone biosynthesis C-methylase UbiE